MANVFDENDPVDTRIEKVAGTIRKRLDGGLTASGKIDLDALKKVDPELHHVLDSFALSKTWRDDPTTTARDVAKLLEARVSTTPLGGALDKLAKNFDK